MIKKGIASNGKEEAEEINRYITKLAGIDVFMKRKYTNDDVINENAMGTFKRNKTNNIIGK
jgi:uncharacterized lipoprotein YehR (DUF1307 family)